jgi:hypothetical protein
MYDLSYKQEHIRNYFICELERGNELFELFKTVKKIPNATFSRLDLFLPYEDITITGSIVNNLFLENEEDDIVIQRKTFKEVFDNNLYQITGEDAEGGFFEKEGYIEFFNSLIQISNHEFDFEIIDNSHTDRIILNLKFQNQSVEFNIGADSDWLDPKAVDCVNQLLELCQMKAKKFYFIIPQGVEEADQCYAITYIPDSVYNELALNGYSEGYFHWQELWVLNEKLKTRYKLNLKLSELLLIQRTSFSLKVIELVKREVESELLLSPRYTAFGDETGDFANDAITIEIKQTKKTIVLRNLRESFNDSGYYPYISEENGKNGLDKLTILKCTNQFDIVRLRGTNGANYNVGNDDIVNNLVKWNEQFGLDIIGADIDWVSFELHELPEDMTSFANELYEFCPDVIDQGFEDIDALIGAISYWRFIQLWWD